MKDLDLKSMYIVVRNVSQYFNPRMVCVYTDKVNMKVFSIHVTSVNIKQHNEEILRCTKKLFTMASNILVINVNLKQHDWQSFANINNRNIP